MYMRIYMYIHTYIKEATPHPPGLGCRIWSPGSSFWSHVEQFWGPSWGFGMSKRHFPGSKSCCPGLVDGE